MPPSLARPYPAVPDEARESGRPRDVSAGIIQRTQPGWREASRDDLTLLESSYRAGFTLNARTAREAPSSTATSSAASCRHRTSAGGGSVPLTSALGTPVPGRHQRRGPRRPSRRTHAMSTGPAPNRPGVDKRRSPRNCRSSQPTTTARLGDDATKGAAPLPTWPLGEVTRSDAPPPPAERTPGVRIRLDPHR